MELNSQFNALMVLGPTASGKTRLAVGLAEALDGEILSADSRQVYRGLDIGSGKDLIEYGDVPYHLIDIAAVGTEFSVFHFQRAFHSAFEKVRTTGKPPVICGGTGLYLEAALNPLRMVAAPVNAVLRAELEGLDLVALEARLRAEKPVLHNVTDLATRERIVRAIEIAVAERNAKPQSSPEVRPLILGTRWERDVLRERIAARLQERLDAGLIEEVDGLIAAGVSVARLMQLGLEYRFVTHYLSGEINSRRDLVQKLNTAIGQFAKRQFSWFRRMERQGRVIHWVDEARLDTALGILRSVQ